MGASGLVVVLCTVPDAETARHLARLLVEARLAACVNIVPSLTSIYRWKGTIEEDGELLLIVKTRDALFEPLRERLVDAHPYEVPEVVALPVDAVHDAYGRWLLDATARDGGGSR